MDFLAVQPPGENGSYSAHTSQSPFYVAEVRPGGYMQRRPQRLSWTLKMDTLRMKSILATKALQQGAVTMDMARLSPAIFTQHGPELIMLPHVELGRRAVSRQSPLRSWRKSWAFTPVCSDGPAMERPSWRRTNDAARPHSGTGQRRLRYRNGGRSLLDHPRGLG